MHVHLEKIILVGSLFDSTRHKFLTPLMVPDMSSIFGQVLKYNLESSWLLS